MYGPGANSLHKNNGNIRRVLVNRELYNGGESGKIDAVLDKTAWPGNKRDWKCLDEKRKRK
ncbi:MAG TPA: hypothetical protein DF613_03890 [Lachnospiraceae bacterium]|nr:hypothetical protein [Lachnospiraceae bacterium]